MEKIIVFGVGSYFKYKRKELEKKYEIYAFIDNTLKGTEIEEIENGKYMYSPKNIENLDDVPIVLMSAKQYEMAKQLIELKVREDRIIFGSSLPPFYDKTEEFLSANNYKLSVKDQKVVFQSDFETIIVNTIDEYKKKVRDMFKNEDNMIALLTQMPLNPVSRRWGLERGMAIDRYYIEKYLCMNSKLISGDVMEIADDEYILKFGSNVNNSIILHVNGWGEKCIKGNLATGEGIKDDWVDCLICTQTLQFIFDLYSAVKNIHRLLKVGGHALITIPGISQISLYDAKRWGDYWRFTVQGVTELFQTEFEKEKVNIKSFGNIKSVCGFLYGVCVEDFEVEDLEYNDEQFPLVLCIDVEK